MKKTLILVVDDDASTRQAYSAFLLDCGYEVLEAAHGGEAILHVHSGRPDMVLLDIVMPVLGGIETAQSLRANRGTADLPIVGITGTSSLSERERMRSVCDDLVLKPCRPEEIATRIGALVGGPGGLADLDRGGVEP